MHTTYPKPSKPPRLLSFLIMIFVGALAVSCSDSDRSASTTLTDRDGNTYRTATIGTQVWLAENLRVTKTPDGVLVTSHWPHDDSSNVQDFGRLYDWQTAIRIAPEGWHLPSDAEWNILETNLGAHAGARLKDTHLWHSPNIGATNATGFSARGAGYWNDSGFDNQFGQRAVFWSATRQDSHFVWSRTLSTDHDTLRRAAQHPQYGFSVRLVRDE